jgi:hypothetical protein
MVFALERMTVEACHRKCALQSVEPELLPELSKRAYSHGLIVAPLGQYDAPASYAAGSASPEAGRPWSYRVLIGQAAYIMSFLEAWQKGDDEMMGYLLGYPRCCRKFFLETWGASSVDPTHSMKMEGGPVEANILLRWAGVRWVFHMPCSFICKDSIKIGERNRRLVENREETKWMDELLSMPMKWSALNGIGEVVTPILTLNFRTDVTRELKFIKREGVYPEAGARGHIFPYRTVKPKQVEVPLSSHEANGFKSRAAMKYAHRIILDVARKLKPKATRVLDLGCGDGALARQIVGSKGYAAGVEYDPIRAKRAEKCLDKVIEGDIFEVDFGKGEYDTVLLMPGRLIEKPSSGDELINYLRLFRDHQRVIFYAYGDWIKGNRSLNVLVNKAGMTRMGRLTNVKRSEGVQAGIWEWMT